jgi:transposase InsO family protein
MRRSVARWLRGGAKINSSPWRSPLRTARVGAAMGVHESTDSQHGLPVAANVLDRQFTVATPNRAWVSDITYLWTQAGWLYLVVILDLFSRRVVGWAMHDRITRQLGVDALTMALGHRKPSPGLVHHSDRGSQYASGEYQAVLEAPARS